MQVFLPWPPADLKPNARANWAKKARAVRAHRGDCHMLCLAAGIRNLGWEAMLVSMTFCPPSRRGGDLDNMLAAMKAGLDGLACASGVDDAHWSITIARGEPVKGGAVHVVVSRPQQIGGAKNG